MFRLGVRRRKKKSKNQTRENLWSPFPSLAPIEKWPKESEECYMYFSNTSRNDSHSRNCNYMGYNVVENLRQSWASISRLFWQFHQGSLDLLRALVTAASISLSLLDRSDYQNMWWSDQNADRCPACPDQWCGRMNICFVHKSCCNLYVSSLVYLVIRKRSLRLLMHSASNARFFPQQHVAYHEKNESFCLTRIKTITPPC